MTMSVREWRARGRGRPFTNRCLTALVCTVLLVLGGCDSGPSGPGTLLGRASGASLGGVVLDVRGRGIKGFSGRGSTQVYSAGVAGAADRYRVVLVDPVGGDLGFDISVDDLGLDGPVVTVVQAARTDNATMSPGGVEIHIERAR